MGNLNNFITRACEKYPVVLNLTAVCAAFLCYFCMYAYRKPFSAGTYEGYSLWGVEFKIIGIIFQVLGYTISKFLGIKVVSEVNPKYRGICIFCFITSSELVLVLFGAIPRPYNAIIMFLNGLPLGMIWGLTFSYLEGRKTSETLGSGMAISFIVSSGIVKSVGQTLIKNGLSQFWMPATVGGIFYIPMCLAVFVLESLPPPSEKDIEIRTERVVMTNKDRTKFCKTFGPGIFFMVFFHMFLTAYRDFRDNFAPELWAAFGYEETPSIFSISEIIVAFVVFIVVALFMLIKKPLNTLIGYHILIIGGQIIIGVCALLNAKGKLPGVYFMVIAGIGLYFGYVPFNSIIFDSIIAVFKYKANSGFLSYLCDSMGYLSSVVILFVKNFVSADLSWLQFFHILSYAIAFMAAIFLSLSLGYYVWKYYHWTPEDQETLDNIEGKYAKDRDSNDETDYTQNSQTIDENLDDDSDSDSVSSVSMSRSGSSSDESDNPKIEV
ncbi:membrane protein [Tritrichomonas foetus]|uniref:Membrane protein n=1 Tax=Tritrichomonas foetus TaxID=1144522 RepID=A0A1J4KIQ5_9EUKA|nr:membrane protein [Tritrichomonas foetus]|eukprot:OHT10816.1 membrane protein [Tritrichomonas foetus]